MPTMLLLVGLLIKHLREWWNRLVQLGPDYGYHPNATTTWLVVKEYHLEEAKVIGSGVSIIADGKRILEPTLDI